jgi:NADPH:quinone reductase-like Zn-dependent oxidoreductase
MGQRDRDVVVGARRYATKRETPGNNVTNRRADSQTFWRDKRVIVTGGVGFLGTYAVQKLRARGAAEIIVPHSRG